MLMRLFRPDDETTDCKATASEAMQDDPASGRKRSSTTAPCPVFGAPHGTESAMPLHKLETGARFCVRTLGGDAALVRRLIDLGLRIGVPARLMQKTPAGYVIAMDGMRLAVDHGLARRIIVQRCPDGFEPA